ncbi:MAG TPA: HAMP domain-containing sensor histidine kinase [Marmoricola sp.]|nr:HAMP domain-containing sensor histidine kinase [Marmoricola sp.]
MPLDELKPRNWQPLRVGRSLTSQIVITTVLVSLVALIVVVTGTYILVHKMINETSESALHRGFHDIASLVTTGTNGRVEVDHTALDSDIRYWVYQWDPSGSATTATLIDSSADDVPAPVAQLSTNSRQQRVNDSDRAYLGGPLLDEQNQQYATLIISENLEPYRSSRNTLLIGLAFAGLIATIGAALTTRWTVRRTLRPVRQMARDADSWSEQAQNTRFETNGGSDEFADLARTLNRLMDRVGTALHSEQRLTSEVAHELRTPLTVILGAAELALAESEDPTLDSHLVRIIDQVHTMNSSITALVQIARDQDQQQNERLDKCLNELAASFSPTPPVRLAVTIEGGRELQMPRDSLTRCLSPLVDNALRFAASKVEIVVRRHEDRLVISVTDDGPGTQGDPFVGTTGLGLPLSRRIAASMGGQVNLTQDSDPTEITLDLPIPRQPAPRRT